MKQFEKLTDMIGNTPLLELHRYGEALSLSATLLGKVEGQNPAGSVKDRVAMAMIQDAESRGVLNPHSVIIEPTSGNTGIGLAAVASSLGYKTILVMPETMSQERRSLLKAYGATLVLTQGSKGMKGAIEKAKELAASTEHSFIPSQFDNPANPAIHERTTGPELWEGSGKNLDVLVAGVGTGGTITGAGRYLKGQNPNLVVVAVEPAGSPVLAGGKPGPHGLQGIGAGFIPSILDTSLLDEILAVTEEEAYAASRLVKETEGLLVGISSGAALHAATVLARRPEFAGKRIAVIFPDGGERYLSTPLFQDVEN